MQRKSVPASSFDCSSECALAPDDATGGAKCKDKKEVPKMKPMNLTMLPMVAPKKNMTERADPAKNETENPAKQKDGGHPPKKSDNTAKSGAHRATNETNKEEGDRKNLFSALKITNEEGHELQPVDNTQLPEVDTTETPVEAPTGSSSNKVGTSEIAKGGIKNPAKQTATATTAMPTQWKMQPEMSPVGQLKRTKFPVWKTMKTLEWR